MDHARVSGAQMTFPTFWRRFLMAIAIGKAGVAGAGLALALLGAFDIAAAISAQHWVAEFQREYVDYFALGGGLVGGAVGVIWNRLTS